MVDAGLLDLVIGEDVVGCFLGAVGLGLEGGLGGAEDGLAGEDVLADV